MEVTKEKQFQPSLRLTKPVTYALSFIRAKDTRVQYEKLLRRFFDFHELPGSNIDEQGQAFLDKVTRFDSDWAQESIMGYLHYHKKERFEIKKEIEAGTLKSYYIPIKKFCDVHRLGSNSIDWKLITGALPKVRMVANDRPYTIEELRKLVKHADRRIKVIVFVTSSSGIRDGAWDDIQWKHFTPIGRDGVIVATKLIAYNEDAEQYVCFITPEAYHAVKEWMDYRALHGEKITPESWLMRDLWQTTEITQRTKRGGNYGLATHPKKISSKDVAKIINRTLKREGIRPPKLPEGKRRYEVKEMHGFRKYFQTRAEQAMKHVNVELLMGHSLGLTGSYYKPSEADLLNDYLRAVPLLTINDESGLQAQVTESSQENERLQKRVVELETQNEKQLEGLRAELNAYIAKSDRSYSELIARLEAIRKAREGQQEQEQQIV